MKIRLHKIRKALTLECGDAIYGNKRIISLILRGFTDQQIVHLATEFFYYWDRPIYWHEKKQKGLKPLDFSNSQLSFRNV